MNKNKVLVGFAHVTHAMGLEPKEITPIYHKIDHVGIKEQSMHRTIIVLPTHIHKYRMDGPSLHLTISYSMISINQKGISKERRKPDICSL